MRHAVFLTAYNRPDYLRRALASWDGVRGLQDWAFVFRIEPDEATLDLNKSLVRDFIRRNELPYHETIVNPTRYGVLHHPWVGFEDLFRDFNFVVRTEDDLCVSDDILDYLAWAELTYRGVSNIASIHAYAKDKSQTPNGVEVLPMFNPLVWGTWRDVWRDVMRDTWDHDYSTYNETPGHQSGWDWNLNTRIYPTLGLKGVYPKMSRVDNIGIVGTHSTPQNWSTAPAFQQVYGVVDYHEM
jgi:hypothetical protein